MLCGSISSVTTCIWGLRPFSSWYALITRTSDPHSSKARGCGITARQWHTPGREAQLASGGDKRSIHLPVAETASAQHTQGWRAH